MARLRELLRSARNSRSAAPAYCPDSGDVIKINFDPQKGREQAGKRPALVLSPKIYNEKARLCVLCPMTNQAKGYPFEVGYPADGTPQSGGAVLADQVKSLSWEEREAEFVGRASEAVVADTLAKIAAILQF